MASVHKHWVGNIYLFVSLYWAPRREKKKARKKKKKALRLDKRSRVVDSFTKMKLMPSTPKFQGAHTFNKQDEEKISKSFQVIPKPCFSEKACFPSIPSIYIKPILPLLCT